MENQVYFSNDRQACSWIAGQSRCWIQTSHAQIAEQIGTWSFATKVGQGVNCPIWIYSVPRQKWRWALKKLGINLPPKNQNQQRNGLQTSKLNFKKGIQRPD